MTPLTETLRSFSSSSPLSDPSVDPSRLRPLSCVPCGIKEFLDVVSSALSSSGPLSLGRVSLSLQETQWKLNLVSSSSFTKIANFRFSGSFFHLQFLKR